MLDQLNKLYETSVFLLPWGTFLIGLLGSLHCLGMCGGLVLSCAPEAKNNIAYQLGRLSSYSVLALLIGYVGSFFKFSKSDPVLTVIPALIIGSTLIWIGLRGFIKNRVSFHTPSKFSNFTHGIWSKIMPKPGQAVSTKTSYSIGAFSIFLPCGLLYGVIAALGAFESPLLALACVITFWCGTLPLMAGAPDIIKRFLRPLQQKLPLLSSAFLILIGLGTIGHRVYLSYQVTSCH